MPLREYKPGTRIPGKSRANDRRIDAGMARAGAREGRSAERAVHHFG